MTMTIAPSVGIDLFQMTIKRLDAVQDLAVAGGVHMPSGTSSDRAGQVMEGATLLAKGNEVLQEAIILQHLDDPTHVARKISGDALELAQISGKAQMITGTHSQPMRLSDFHGGGVFDRAISNARDGIRLLETIGS